MIKKKNNDSKIESFLKANPNFFIENPELLKKLNFPLIEQNTDNDFNIISFKDWIIKTLKKKQKQIINNAQFNFFTQKKVHKAVIKLLQINDFRLIMEFVHQSLSKELDIDCVVIVSSSKKVLDYGGSFIEEEKFNPLIQNRKTIIMDAVDEELGIFKSFPFKVYSNALCIIEENILNYPVILALGSKDKLFIDNKGSDLIIFFSEIFKQHIKNIKKNA